MSFDFTPLNRVIFAPGVLSQIGSLAAELGGRTIFLVTDRGLATVGHPQRATSILESAGLKVVVWDDVKENPTSQQVADGAAIAKAADINLIVSLGGGSAMDAAKGVNFILTNGGTMADYKGMGRAKSPMLPSIGIPTTTGTGSEAQSYALITDTSSRMKMACGDKKAAFRIAILDPELTVSQPAYISAVTGIDAIAHAIESIVCKKSTPVSKVFSQSAWDYLSSSFDRTISHPLDIAARAGMQIGSHFAGVAIENAMLGVCHSCANPLTAHYGITHGSAIGTLLPHVIRFNSVVCEQDYALMGGSDFLASYITNLLCKTGLPTQLREYGVAESILPLLASEAGQQWTAQFNPRTVTEEDLLDIYRSAW
ncbi:MAG: iron-containing alcohol dehydrogenase [Zavarzinella sp.]